MKCFWCGTDRAGQNGEGFCDEEGLVPYRRWYCDGCLVMWEYGEDATGFYQELCTEKRPVGPRVELDGCMVVMDGWIPVVPGKGMMRRG